MKILAIPGSLRNNSSSNKLMTFISTILPTEVHYQIYEDLASIPAFDDREDIPSAVAQFKKAISDADALLLCTPEYAFGVPGALKNAIDWTVSSGELVEKPVALITASSQGEKGHAAMLNILSALSTKTPPSSTLLISFIKAKLNDKGEITNPELIDQLKAVIHSMASALQSTSTK